MPGVIDPAALFAPLDVYPRLGLAVSGGADSLALMLLAAQFAQTPEARHRFVVYSVDHALRPEAADEVRFVLAEAGRLGFAARGLRWAGAKPASGLQEAARHARYSLMGAAMRADGVPVLLTAHHLGDQAETVLMRLAHGSGVEGLRGMDDHVEIDGVHLVRPLLGIDPAHLRRLVDDAGLVPVADPSNADPDYERVRWRQALPMLATLGLDANRLGRFAARMRDADAALAHAADQAIAELGESGVGAPMARAWLMDLPRAVAVRVVGRALAQIGGGQKPHALGAIERLTERIGREPFKTTLHGCVITSDGTRVTIAKEAGRAAAAAGRDPADHDRV